MKVRSIPLLNKKYRGVLLGWAGVFFVLLFHLWLSPRIDPGGDAFHKWFEVKRLIYGFSYSVIDHHTMRWGINFPLYCVQKIFGTSPSVYYVAPTLAIVFLSTFIYKILYPLAGLFVAIMAVTLVNIHPVIMHDGSQLHPDIFMAAYLFGCFYYLQCYQIRESGKCYLFISALLFLFAYGTKVVSLFVLPAPLLFLLLRKDVRGAVYYCIFLGCGFLVENIWICSMTGDYLQIGRLNAMTGHFGAMSDINSSKLYNYNDILLRWTKLPDYWLTLVVVGIFVSFSTILQRRKHDILLLLSVANLLFIIFTTFALTSVNPVKFLQPPNDRYVLLTVPLSFVLILAWIRMRIACHKFIFPLLLLAALRVCWLSYSDYDLSYWHNLPAVNSFQNRAMKYFNDGYALVFYTRKEADLFQAVFLEDSVIFKNEKIQDLVQEAPDNNKIYLMVNDLTTLPKGFVFLNPMLNHHRYILRVSNEAHYSNSML